MIAQSLLAHLHYMDAPRRPHSMRLHFLRPVVDGRPIDFAIQATDNPDVFQTIIGQEGKAALIGTSLCSSHWEDADVRRLHPMPPAPEFFPSLDDVGLKLREGTPIEVFHNCFVSLSGVSLFDMRLIHSSEKQRRNIFWAKYKWPAPDLAGVAVAALLTDHDPVIKKYQMKRDETGNASYWAATLNHSLFIRKHDISPSQWFLLITDYPSFSLERETIEYTVFDEEGRRVVTARQEAYLPRSIPKL